jgi:hypothetical protein
MHLTALRNIFHALESWPLLPHLVKLTAMIKVYVVNTMNWIMYSLKLITVFLSIESKSNSPHVRDISQAL